MINYWMNERMNDKLMINYWMKEWMNEEMNKSAMKVCHMILDILYIVFEGHIVFFLI